MRVIPLSFVLSFFLGAISLLDAQTMIAPDSTGFLTDQATASLLQKSKITASDYCYFLNRIAPKDSHHLYEEIMISDPLAACIVRQGEPGNYYYSVVAGWENTPIVFVTWLDEARYCNWIDHGEPTLAQDANSTETGVYDLDKILDDDLCGELPLPDKSGFCWVADEEIVAKANLPVSLSSNELPFLMTDNTGGSGLSINTSEIARNGLLASGATLGSCLGIFFAYSLLTGDEKSPVMYDRDCSRESCNTANEQIYLSQQINKASPGTCEQADGKTISKECRLSSIDGNNLQKVIPVEKPSNIKKILKTSQQPEEQTIASINEGEGIKVDKKKKRVNWRDLDIKGQPLRNISIADYYEIGAQPNQKCDINEHIIDFETRKPYVNILSEKIAFSIFFVGTISEIANEAIGYYHEHHHHRMNPQTS